VDAFAFAASAVSAAAVFESLLGFAFPLFGQDMYVRLGYGGGNSLLAGLAIIIGIPFPIWIWYKGENIRKRSAAYLAPDVCLDFFNFRCHCRLITTFIAVGVTVFLSALPQSPNTMPRMKLFLL